MPYLSIVIPTLNRYSDLEDTLRDLSIQSYHDFEILIIDQTPAPKKLPIASMRVKWLWVETASASLARNIGIKESSGEIVLFLDDDVIIKNENFLYNHIRHYNNPILSGVAGCIMELDGLKRVSRHKISYRSDVGWLFFPRNYAYPEIVKTGGSGNLSVRRVMAIECGGMDENYIKGAHREESDFCMRLTHQFGNLIYDPEADLIHIGSPKGGIRNWTHPLAFVKQQQHFDGAFYFIFRNVKLKELPFHLFATFKFFLYDRKLLSRPYLIFVVFYRSFIGFIRAFRIRNRPKYINLQ